MHERGCPYAVTTLFLFALLCYFCPGIKKLLQSPIADDEVILEAPVETIIKRRQQVTVTWFAVPQLASLLLTMTYRSSANEPDVVVLSFGSVKSPGTNLELEDASDAEVISADGENEEDFVLPGDTYTIKPSRRELMALRSELGSHWNSPSKRRMRRNSRTRSCPQYFQPM